MNQAGKGTTVVCCLGSCDRGLNSIRFFFFTDRATFSDFKYFFCNNGSVFRHMVDLPVKGIKKSIFS